MKQLSNRHQYDVDRNDDRRGSKHQQLFFSPGVCIICDKLDKLQASIWIWCI